MRAASLSAAALLLATACSVQPQQATVAAGNAQADSACSYTIDPPGADGVAVLRGRCDTPAAGLALVLGGSPQALRGAKELALGRTAFVEDGIFGRCAFLPKLIADPRWTARTDSAMAVAPLRDALAAAGPAAPVRAALAAQGKRIGRISVETVLIGRQPDSACAKGATVVPSEALVWLVFD